MSQPYPERIRSWQDLKLFLALDKQALRRTQRRPKWFGDEIWKFQRALRTLEYFDNRDRPAWMRWFVKPFVRHRYHRLSIACGFTIPCHTFGPGLLLGAPRHRHCEQ